VRNLSTNITKKTLEFLADESENLKQCEVYPDSKKDFIFSEYENTPVDFNIYVGDKFNILSEEENPEGVRIIDNIFKLYTECEYSEDQRMQTVVFKQMKNKAKRTPNNLFWDAPNWRLSASPHRDDNSDIEGFTISLFHNYEGYPTKKTIDGAGHQLKYRQLINKIEKYLIQSNVEYSIQTN